MRRLGCRRSVAENSLPDVLEIMVPRALAIAATTTTAILVAAPAATATRMTPLVTCVEKTDAGYLAHFGYRNDESSTVTRTVARSEGRNAWLNLVYNGPANDWSSVNDATLDRGQPTTFLPGTHQDVFTVPFTSGVVTWALVGRWATASAASPACTTPQPEPEPQPEPQPQPQPQPAAPAPPVATAAEVPAAAPPVTAAGPRTCTSRRVLTIRIRERKGQRIRRARVIFNGRRIASSRRTSDGRLIARIDFRRLPSGRFSVQIRATLTNGKTRTYTRRYFTCKPKLGPANSLGSKTAL